MTRSRRGLCLALAAGFAATSCSTTQEDAEKGAAGIARLSSLSVAALGGVLLGDKGCGFANENVRARGVVTTSAGGAGSASYTVRDCTLDFGANPVTLKDCTGAETRLTGKVTVTATLTLSGGTTGDPANPIIAADPDSLTITISRATVTDFAVLFPNAPATLTMREGQLSAIVKPRLAAESTANLCAIPTQDTGIAALDLKGVNLKVESEDQTSFIFVVTSSVSATIGKGATSENVYSGSVTLPNQTISLPPESDNATLDSGYDRAMFEARFSCTQGLAQPVSYACGTTAAGEQAAQAVARLTVPAVSSIVAILEQDTTCGFASANVKAAAMQNGTVGGRGQVVYSTTACRIEIPEDRVLATDCTGRQIRAQGKLTVTARKLLTGVVTGEPQVPIFPVTDAPAVYELTEVVFDGFRTATSTSAALIQAAGKLSAKVTPRVARGVRSQACTVRTQIAKVEDVKYDDAIVTLEAGGAVTLSVLDSDFDATVGSWDSASNTLSGSVNIAGEQHTLPAGEGLDPTFQQASFDASWQCDPDLLVPASFECDRTVFVADGVARLTPQLFGTIVQLAETDRRCGFSSAAVAGMPTPAPGAQVGSVAAVTFRIQNACTISFPRETSLGADCNGIETFVRGSFSVTGTRVVTGYLTGDPAAPVIPVGRDPVEYTLEAMATNLEISTSTTPLAIRMVRGAITGKAKPRFAIDTTSGACTQPTPNLQMIDLAYRGALVQLGVQGLTFGFDVTTSDIDAQIGIRDTEANSFSGSITTAGMRITLPVDPSQAPLIPGFNPTRWRGGYACRPNLLEAPNEQACSFRRVLAPVVARLAVQNVATALQLVASDQTCGFSSPNVLLMPLAAQGMVGGPGVVVNAVPRPAGTTCIINRNTPMPIENCLRERTLPSGSFTVTATRTTPGFRVQDCSAGPQLCVQLAVPGTRDAMTVGVGNMTFTNFASALLSPGQTAATRLLTFRGGRASFSAVPILGEDAMMALTVPTPIARFTDVRLRGIPVTLLLDGKTFRATIDDSDLDASIGVFPARTGNTISGSITLDGEVIPLAAAPLDPDYNQSRFDLSYDCTPRLARVVPSN